MNYSKKSRRLFAINLVILLILSMFSTGLGFAAERKSASVDMNSVSPQVATAKISPQLSKEFDKEEYVTYLIRMKEQVDVEQVSAQAMKVSVARNETPAVSKMSVRNTVVSSLRETSSISQASIIQYLDEMKEKGEVKEYESFFIVNALAITSTQEVMEKLAYHYEVEKILPNKEHFLDKVERSPEQISLQAGKENAPSNIEWNIEQVNAPQVWEMGIDGSGIVIANLDSGVELTHPALQRKWRGYDANGNIANPELHWYDAHSGASLPTDTDGHGTHVMGTSVGSEENGTNVVGVAPGAQWIAVRIFNPSTTDQIILRGGQWILAPVDSEGNLHPELAPDVVTNSWGGGPGINEWFRPIVQAWRAAEIFPEFSAGNTRATNPGGPGSVATPANYPESFAVGATDINNNLAGFSLRGPSPYGEIKPQVSAPGVNIRSSVPGGGYEGGWNGTSMSGPHVSGLVALLLQVNSSLTVDQLEEIIESTAIPLTNSEYPEVPNNGFGHGLINCYDAVMSILSGLGSVSGRVTTEGDDFDPPVLDHTPVTNAFSGSDIPLTAQVSDNVGVVTVEAFARTVGSAHWTFIPMDRTAGDYKAGTYQGDIPRFLVSSSGVEYYLRVNDYGNNGFKTNTYRIDVSDGITPGYFQDFETNIMGIETGGQNNSWEWGVPTSGPNGAYSGEKVMATNLSGLYPNGSNAYMKLPPLDLKAEEDGALLSFKHWYDFENNYDYGAVFVAAESTDFQLREVTRFTGTSDGWQTTFIDLREFAGEQVHLLFNMYSDGSVNRAGWYLDDIQLQEIDNVPPAAPANLQAEADSIGNVNLSWEPVADEDLAKYYVYRSTESGVNYEKVGTSTTPSYTDGDTPFASTFYYVVKAVDYSGNESAPSNEASVTITPPVVIFSDDFEGEDDNGWTHSGANDPWQRGVPTAGPANAVSGEKVWATNLSGDYQNNTNASLVSPAIDLTSVDNAILSFYHWYEIETRWDHGYVEVSTDNGQNWIQLADYNHSTEGREWAEVSINLNEYVGETVQVRYRLTSDNSVVKKGWYIDNFRILSIQGDAGTDKKNADEFLKAIDSKDKEKEKDQKAKPLFPYLTPDFAVKKKPVYDEPQYDFSKKEKAEKVETIVKAVEAKVEGATPQALPAHATVTVLETGRSTKTDASNGRYHLVHAAGDFTLRAEAYGYYPSEKSVSISDGENAVVNFALQAIPFGTVTGIISDERSGEPIANATILVREDSRISPVVTDENGSFTLDVLEGTYTLVVTAADYYNNEVTVEVPGNQTVTANVGLKPFIGYAGEIAYDDGEPENARAFYDAGNGWAVRMTPENGAAQVIGAKFRFWDTSWPTPGGTAFKYAVYDASGPNGAPGRVLAGPFDGTALRDGQWTEVSFPESVMVEGDFYIVYIQASPNPNAPGLATDESSPNAMRGWQLVGGAWNPTPEEQGNYMIRALVQYPVGAPAITSPSNDSFTNSEAITVTGISSANGATVKLYNGDEEVGSGIVEEGQFSIETTLHDGENLLSTEAVVDGKLTDRSEPIRVTLDQAAPDLEVTSPVDGQKQNQEVLHVNGSVSDAHFDALTVNGNDVQVNEDGSFSYRMLVNAGENVITVVATDLAGNETTVTRTIEVVLGELVISNVTPAEDVHITSGETVHVSFEAAEGLGAAFRVEVPLMMSGGRANEIVMTETAPGFYEGSWTTPANLNVSGAIVVVRAWDEAGNGAEALAAGKLYISTGGSSNPDPDPIEEGPTAVIVAPDSGNKNKNISFDASRSSDNNGKIRSYEWDFGDGTTASKAKVKHKYKQAGTYTVTLTVTNRAGETATTTHTIEIR
nr:S8 family serine peptidase [Caldalkalibacillus mannanilyticus]